MAIFLLRNVKLSVLLFLISTKKCTFAPVKLIIDIGNTVAKLVAFEGEEPIEEIKTSNETLAALPAFASKYHFERGIVGSVIGIPEAVKEMLKSMPFPILHFTPDTPIPICNKYKTPQTLGPDRLAAAVGASILKPGKDILIIDAGTCITYDVIDGKEVVKPEVQKLLDTDRGQYDALYGADDAYWMFQDNVMQLKWKQETQGPIDQLEKWTYPYATYTGVYDIILPADTEDAYTNARIQKLWSETLQNLLLAKSEKKFDEILEKFVTDRNAMGFTQLQEKRYKYVESAKEKLGIE